MRDVFQLPEGHVQIAFSGGRTSAYMLYHILEANGDLPDRVVVTFQNTGREMPQTLDFVHECASRWNVDVIWLEYRPQTPFFEIVSHNNASRKGEPFEALIQKRKYLPNVVTRFCSVELKIRTAKRYLVDQSWTHWTNCVGFRADEPHRLNKPKPRDRWVVWHPLADCGVTKSDVARFWDAQSFDLRLPNIDGVCWLGNCDGCFLKSEGKLSHLARSYPKRHAWWEHMEEQVGQFTNGSGATFSKSYSRADIRRHVEQQGDWIFDTEDALCQVDGGECAA